MRDYLDANTILAIQSRTAIVPANFLWITAKNRETGNPESLGLWSGWDTVEAQVLDVDTRLPLTRTYHAGGGVLEWPAIPLESDLTIRTIRIRLSQINTAVLDAIVGYDAKHAPVEIHRAYLDPDTILPVAPAVPRFVGWINAAPKRIPAVGGEGGIELSIVSHARALTKVNPLKRSDEQQRRRSGDRFRRYTDVAGGWLANVHWGEEKAKPNTDKNQGAVHKITPTGRP